MKIFVSALIVCTGVAAYAGDVANPHCAWSVSGYACDETAVAAVPEFHVGRSRV